MGGTLYTDNLFEILVDGKFLRILIELMKGSVFMMKVGLRKILVKKVLASFFIRIQIQDLDPDSNPDPKLTSGRIRIRNHQPCTESTYFLS